jgi:hypothetical protein
MGNRRPATEAYLDQLRATVRDHGWAVQGVFATETSDQRFDFVYTVGLIQRGCTAELLIAGIPMRTGAGILNEIAADMASTGQTIPPAEWEVADGFVLKAVTFTPRSGHELHVGAARAYYNAPVPVAQYVWPDQQHHYPWDAEWDARMLQPYGNG